MNRLDVGGLMVRLEKTKEAERGVTETPKSLGTVIKMVPWFGDEKACLALRVH